MCIFFEKCVTFVSTNPATGRTIQHSSYRSQHRHPHSRLTDRPMDQTRPDQNRPKRTQTLVEQPTMQCNASLHPAYRTSSPNQTQLTSLLLLANWGPLSGNREPRTANPDGSRCVNCRLQSRCARLAVRDISLPRSFPSMAEEPGCSCTCVDVMFSALGRPARIGRDLCRGRLVRYSACGRKAGVGWEKKRQRGERGGGKTARRARRARSSSSPLSGSLSPSRPPVSPCRVSTPFPRTCRFTVGVPCRLRQLGGHGMTQPFS